MLNIEGHNVCILVVSGGHVFVGKPVNDGEGTIQLYDARVIRTWGSDRGLNKLFHGPTKDTILDQQAPLILIPEPQIIYVLPVQDNPAWWETK